MSLRNDPYFVIGRIQGVLSRREQAPDYDNMDEIRQIIWDFEVAVTKEGYQIGFVDNKEVGFNEE